MNPTPDSRLWRASFAGVLLWAMGLSTFLQFAVGVLAPFITAELDISRAELGLLTTVFFITGALGSPIAGPLVDRFGGRRMLLVLFVLGGLAPVGLGVAPTYLWLLAAMAVGGVATAIGNPVTNLLIALHLPRGAQGVITGVKQSGVQLASFLSGALLPALALLVGWRGALAIVALTALVGLAMTVWLIPPAEARARGREGAPPPAPLGRFVSWLAGYAFLMGAGLGAVVAFAVLYAVEVLDFDEPTAGLIAAVLGLVGVVARIVWGRAAEHMRTATAPLLLLALISTGAQGLIWAATGAAWLLWPGVLLYGASAGAWNAVGMLAIVREVDPSATGKASGVVQGAFYAGFVACPVLFGYSVDVTGGYNLGWAAVTAIFGLATLLAFAWHRRTRLRQAAHEPA